MSRGRISHQLYRLIQAEYTSGIRSMANRNTSPGSRNQRPALPIAIARARFPLLSEDPVRARVNLLERGVERQLAGGELAGRHPEIFLDVGVLAQPPPLLCDLQAVEQRLGVGQRRPRARILEHRRARAVDR